MNPSDKDDAFSISGLAVQVVPQRISEVTEALNSMSGVEVHLSDDSGKLVVTVEESAGEKTMVDTMTRISQVDGVISSALVYTHQEG